MSLIVKSLEESAFSFRQYYDFIQNAYAERIEQGIPFVCTTLNEKELKEDIDSNGCRIYIGFFEEAPSEIAASISVSYRCDKEGKYAWYHLVATNSKLKGRGIGSQMLSTMIDIAVNEKCSHVSLTTAANAISAVKFYLKNGFIIESYTIPLVGGYKSYVFRYQIKHPSKWDKKWYCKYHYISKIPKQWIKKLTGPIFKFVKR